MTPTDEEIRAPIGRVLMQVAELPDRSSPEDWPEAMLVTTEELGAIIRNEFSPLAEEVLRLRAEVASLTAERDAEGCKADEWMTANAIMDDHFVPCGQLEDRIGMVLNEAADMRIANEKLEAEVAKMRALLVDLDLWGINHKALCAKVDETPCDCGADDLQRRINEVTT